MIIVEDNSIVKPSIDPPPDYEPQQQASSAKAVNYVSIVRQLGSLSASYVLDPTLHVPDALLPPLPFGYPPDARKHLSLETMTGGMSADITLVECNASEADVMHKSGRATMELRTRIGSLSATVHAPGVENRTRFFLAAYSTTSGSITIAIPRSFRGPVVICVPVGFVNVSKALAAHFTTISEAKHTRRAYIGNMSGPELVDEIYAETTVGHVTLLYEDEVANSKLGGYEKMTSGLFGKVFGRWNSSP